MKEIYIFLLKLIIIIQMFGALFILFGGIKSVEYAKLNVMVIIPIIVLINLLPIDFFETSKKYIVSKYIDYSNDNKTAEEIIEENSNTFILPKIHKIISNRYFVDNINTFNPVTYQGILVLALIINVYLLKYKWNLIK